VVRAIANGDPFEISNLLNNGLNPNAQAPSGETLVWLAARHHRQMAVQLLLRAGANLGERVRHREMRRQWSARPWVCFAFPHPCDITGEPRDRIVARSFVVTEYFECLHALQLRGARAWIQAAIVPKKLSGGTTPPEWPALVCYGNYPDFGAVVPSRPLWVQLSFGPNDLEGRLGISEGFKYADVIIGEEV
jgi:hypothetical protein